MPRRPRVQHESELAFTQAVVQLVDVRPHCAMKRCAYCGRDNPDDAIQCNSCGTGDFVPPPSERASKGRVEKESGSEQRSRRVTGASVTKFVGGLVCIVIGVGMHLQPVASDTFWPSTKYSGPHTVHHSADQMSIFGVGLCLLGVGLICSIFFGSRK